MNSNEAEKIIFKSDKPVPVEILPTEIGTERWNCKWMCWITPSGGIQCGFKCEG